MPAYRLAFALLLLPFPPVLRAQARPLAEIPIALENQKTIVPVTVGGRTLRLILDSGMDYDGVVVFDTSKVDLRRFEHLSQAQVGGAGSGPPARALYDSAATFSIGGLEFRNQRAIILTSGIYQGFPTDGVVGHSLLGHYAVELDYDAGLMRLFEATSFTPAAGWTPIDLYFRGGRVPRLDLLVATGTEAPVRLTTYIDFASREALELLDSGRNRYRTPALGEERVIGRGLSGDVTGRYGTVAKVAIGPHTLERVQVVVTPAEARAKQAVVPDAIVGNDLLRRFNLVFDYAHSKLWIRPNRAFGEPFR